uniref:DUF2169 family type VI secretion system accessory protein n=1 Tax=Aquisalimonas sp. TaxID=1872621 RepID=UPI0025C1FE24
MWLLENKTPFATDNTWVRDENGAEEWIVAIKGSFVIQPDGQQVLDEEQAKIAYFPEFHGAPETSSLAHEADLIHKKPRTDVIVDGCAFSPNGQAAEAVDVRVKVSNIDKTLRVHGDRIIERGVLGVRLSRSVPFTRLPIRYERAFGGTDQTDQDPKRHGWEPRNPVGVGFAMRRKNVIGSRAPNIEYPNRPYHDWWRGTPAGFGPVPRHWLPRVNLAGTYDAHWEKTRNPLLPSDFDERFYQCAPEDQQAKGHLQGGEVVELYNMTPNGFLTFRLPKVAFAMRTRFYDGTVAEHRAVLHTVTLQPETRRFQ